MGVRVCMGVCVLRRSVMSDSLPLHGWTVACQAPLSMEFSRQKYWSRLPFLPPGDLPDAGIEAASLVSPALADGFFTTGFFASWEAPYTNTHTHN